MADVQKINGYNIKDARSREDIAATQESLATTQENLTATQESLATTQENLTATQESLATTQENLTATQESLASLENENLTELVVIGDSYTARDSSFWAEKLAEQLHLNLHKHAVSSMGFAHAVNGETFIDLLGSETGAIRSKVKYVICYGGINDYDQQLTTIRTAVINFANQAKQDYPNARIILVGPQTDASQFSATSRRTIALAMSVGALQTGVAWSDASDWLWNNQGIAYTQSYESDHLHPSELGNYIIVSKMLDLIAGNNRTLPMSIKLFEGVNNDAVVYVSSEGDATHIVARLNNITATNGVYTQALQIDSDMLYFFPLMEGVMPVYKMSAFSDVAYVTGLLGFTNVTSSGAIRFVNTSGADYTGPILIKGDIHVGSVRVI